ncbi:MAG: hypothetical protein AAF944_26355 [Bacteroidota bacterium]
MMKALSRKITIPNYLHEIHGKQALLVELLITYVTGIIATIVTLYLAWDSSLSVYQFVLLGILALDLAAGVVANLTPGAKAYYSESARRRYLFIAFHVLQPVLLMWIFPAQALSIGWVAGYTLLAMTFVNSLQEPSAQRVYAFFLLVVGILLLFLLGISAAVVQLMLILFVIKLVVAFAVRWKHDKV